MIRKIRGEKLGETKDGKGKNQKTIDNRLEVLVNIEKLPKLLKLSATYEDEFEIPIYQYSEWQFLIFTLMYYSQHRIDGTS